MLRCLNAGGDRPCPTLTFTMAGEMKILFDLANAIINLASLIVCGLFTVLLAGILIFIAICCLAFLKVTVFG